jgi:hypothetical protein
MRRDTLPLVNLQPGEFVYFSYYAAAGLVLPVSSFLFTLLEYYGLQLQHLSPHSLVLVVIFIHFCEMFVCVWPVDHLVLDVPRAAMVREGLRPDQRLLLPDLGHVADCIHRDHQLW